MSNEYADIEVISFKDDTYRCSPSASGASVDTSVFKF